MLFDIADTGDGVSSDPLEWYRRGYRACAHSRRKLWFGRKAGIGGHVCGFQAIWIVGPFLRKIQRAVDKPRVVGQFEMCRGRLHSSAFAVSRQVGWLRRVCSSRMMLVKKYGEAISH